nr:peptidoglycan-binding domain-containing protein [Micromonospora sp. DSM 115978]
MRHKSLLAMAGVTSGLAALLAPSAATAAPTEPEAPAVTPEKHAGVPAAALAADVCWSWTDYVTGPGVRYDVLIPSTTRNGGQANCVLYSGISSDGVYKLQDALIRCYGRNIARDGAYGSQTKAAVEYVQRRHGLTPDGTYGPNTRAAMTWPKYRNGAFNHC